MGHGAWGMRHEAWGMGHRAWGMGHRVLVVRKRLIKAVIDALSEKRFTHTYFLPCAMRHAPCPYILSPMRHAPCPVPIYPFSHALCPMPHALSSTIVTTLNVIRTFTLPTPW
ncbi:MAG: hypothetical protein KME33_18790 [Aetokthonos hydrillicola CCALA 1050]|nr:hypothetical protein [Aetokthonos hydrillicola CCALA 1050]